jgi:cytochrome P450
MLNYITQTPIDDEQTDVRIHFSMKRLPDEAATGAVAELNERITNDQFRQDVPIWENRAWVERPRLTEIDGPVAQYRRWYRQFYSDWDDQHEGRSAMTAAPLAANATSSTDPFSYEQDDDPYPSIAGCATTRRPTATSGSTSGRSRASRDNYDAFLDPATYSSSWGTSLEFMEGPKDAMGLMIYMDAPRHNAVPQARVEGLHARRMRTLEPLIRGLAAKHLDALVGRPRFDVVRDFTARLPMDVISTLLGIPEADRGEVQRKSNMMLHREPGNPMPSQEAIRCSLELIPYMNDQIADRRARPKDDLLTDLVQVEVADDDGVLSRLTDEEIRSFFILLATAGNETVTKLLATAFYELAQHPDQRRILVAEPQWTANAVEETLRWDPPSQYQGRVTTRSVTIHGTTIPARAKVALINGATGRDERRFADPDRFDVKRTIDLHLGFGYGRHFCLGASLARLEDAHRHRGVPAPVARVRGTGGRHRAHALEQRARAPGPRDRAGPMTAARFPFPIPTGWFAVAWSDDLAPGDVKTLRYFGPSSSSSAARTARRMRSTRTARISARISAAVPSTATCSCVRSMRGGGTATGAAPASRTRSASRRRHACAPGRRPSTAARSTCGTTRAAAAPTFEVPTHPELSDPTWQWVERHEFTIATCIQEIAENAHDPAHFMAVHGVPGLPENTARFEGATQVSENRGKFETPRGPVETSIRGVSYGLGVGHLRTRGLADMAQLLLQTPIDAEHVHVRWQFAVPVVDGRPSPVGVAFAREFVRQFHQDIPIWETKRFFERPILCEGDGQIAALRRWARQFYPGAAGAEETSA